MNLGIGMTSDLYPLEQSLLSARDSHEEFSPHLPPPPCDLIKMHEST